eukprot:SAG11_NODE_54220_length_101_cov_105.000000_1_plen_33_part_11
MDQPYVPVPHSALFNDPVLYRSVWEDFTIGLPA